MRGSLSSAALSNRSPVVRMVIRVKSLPIALLLACAASCSPKPFVTHHDNGQLWEEVVLEHGGRNGSYRKFFESGAPEVTGHYSDGLPDGEWTWWYEDGTVAARSSYRNGRRHGLWQTWHANGQLKSEGRWEAGNRVGVWTEFEADGTQVGEHTWDAGTRTRMRRL